MAGLHVEVEGKNENDAPESGSDIPSSFSDLYIEGSRECLAGGYTYGRMLIVEEVQESASSTTDINNPIPLALDLNAQQAGLYATAGYPHGYTSTAEGIQERNAQRTGDIDAIASLKPSEQKEAPFSPENPALGQALATGDPVSEGSSGPGHATFSHSMSTGSPYDAVGYSDIPLEHHSVAPYTHATYASTLKSTWNNPLPDSSNAGHHKTQEHLLVAQQLWVEQNPKIPSPIQPGAAQQYTYKTTYATYTTEPLETSTAQEDTASTWSDNTQDIPIDNVNQEQLMKWLYETSNSKLTFAEWMEKKHWEKERFERL